MHVLPPVLCERVCFPLAASHASNHDWVRPNEERHFYANFHPAMSSSFLIFFFSPTPFLFRRVRNLFPPFYLYLFTVSFCLVTPVPYWVLLPVQCTCLLLLREQLHRKPIPHFNLKDNSFLYPTKYFYSTEEITGNSAVLFLFMAWRTCIHRAVVIILLRSLFIAYEINTAGNLGIEEIYRRYNIKVMQFPYPGNISTVQFYYTNLLAISY